MGAGSRTAMLDELERLTLALGAVSVEDARGMLDAINDHVADVLRATAVLVYWHEATEDGAVLKPLAFVNHSGESDPMQFDLAAKPDGPVSWAYHRAQPLWLEHLRTPAGERDAPNLAAAGSTISRALLERVRYVPDSLLAVPIVVRGEARGVYVIQLATSGVLSRGAVRFVSRLTQSIGRMVWNADVYDFDQRKSRDAIRRFLSATADFSFSQSLVEESVRTCFIARPFEEPFAAVEEALQLLVAEHGIRATAYTPRRGRHVLDEIIEQIEDAHFCIADVTGANPNVMAEVGMMLMAQKEFLTLRRHDDATEIPFDIQHRHVYSYELSEAGGLTFWSEASRAWEDIDGALDRFTEQLPASSGFFAAERWSGRP